VATYFALSIVGEYGSETWEVSDGQAADPATESFNPAGTIKFEDGKFYVYSDETGWHRTRIAGGPGAETLSFDD
jgi:hypothetical protein